MIFGQNPEENRAAYRQFLDAKRPRAHAQGLAKLPPLLPALKPHQRDCVAFGLTQGRWACFLDTGLGKSLIELEWCRHAAHATNGLALILTPLAVAGQMAREAERFGIPARVIREQAEAAPGVNICNYDRLDRLNPAAFGAVALDESSILKSFTGATTRALISAFAGTPFRMAATATPAPNDHMELGQHAEFLGVMSGVEMLSRFFINDTSTASQQWRLKRHAERSFWDWVSSWARMAETPADLEHDATDYILPPLRVHRHRAAGDVRAPAGALFAADVSATTMYDVKRQTAGARAEMCAALVPAGEACVIWCDTDHEADALKVAIPEAIEVRGSMPAEKKEAALAAFSTGEARILITKPSIAGFGMNWQHCSTMIFAGRTFSYEAWYQAVRRCWRFGQARPVDCHLIVAEGEDQIGRVIERKAADHASMKRAMAEAMRRNRATTAQTRVVYQPTTKGSLPAWLTA
jgi:superfamily II DNA or RNA helicase